MKKNKILVVGFLLSTLVVSCSQSKHEKISENKSSDEKVLKSDNETYIGKSKDIKIENVERSKLLGQRTISFNGEKYLFDGEKLRKGSQVRNIHMSEQGRIKGTFVIVVKAGEILNLPFKSKTKIAKDTFRLIPAQDDDLMTAYKQLLADKNLIRVELEVDYSPVNKSMAYE